MKKLLIKTTLESTIFEDKHHDNCSVCGRHFVVGETTYLGYNAQKQLINIGECCKQCLSSTITDHTYKKRHYKKPNDSDILWRYLSFPKFVSMLKSQSLFFTRVDKFEDPFEGAKGIADNESKWDESYKVFLQQMITHLSKRIDIPYKTHEQIEACCASLLSDIKIANAISRQHTYVNCWHKNDFESEAMWKLYCPDIKQGIAIKTTYGKLFDALNKKRYIQIGEIQYIDYTNKLLEGDDAFWYKRKSFEHEKEVRAIIHHYQGLEEPMGLNIPVPINDLINSIYISPMAPQWFVEIVKDVSGKYGLSKPILQSQMTAKPFY